MNLRRILRFIAKIGHPILRVLGVKKGTVADKVADGAEIVDGALPEEVDPEKHSAK